MKKYSYLSLTTFLFLVLHASSQFSSQESYQGLMIPKTSHLNNCSSKIDRNQSQDPNRNLQENRPLKITANFDAIKPYIPPEILHIVQRAFRIASFFYGELVQISSLDSDNKVIFPEGMTSCYEITFSEDDLKNGIEDSDLHVYLAFYNDDSIIDYVTICSFYNNKRVNIGIIRLFFQQFEGIHDNNLLQSLILNELLHKLFHLLGTNKDFLMKFLDPQGQQLLIEDIFQKVEYSFSFFILKTPKLQELSRSFTGCSSLDGPILDQNQGKNLHFSRVLVDPSSLGVQIFPSWKITVSSFDVAFLEDTGLYSQISHSFQDGTQESSSAKGRGCDFIEQQCSNEQFDDFCNLGSESKCDTSFIGIASCNLVMRNMPCRMFQILSVSSLCRNSNSNYYRNTNYFGADSMCFESNLAVNDKDDVQTDLARCLKTTCLNGNTQVQIQFKDEIFLCETNGSILNSNLYSGYVKCPNNILSFCQTNVSICPNECSQNGICINGNCHCLTGYSGPDCSIVSCVENKSFGCIQCSNNHCLQCTNGLLLSLDRRECVEDCEQGQFKDETNVCRSCPENCTRCTSLLACQECSQTTILSFENLCVSQCTDGFFKEQVNNEFKCSVCHHNCSKCYGPSYTQCSSCRKFYSLVNGTTCTHPKCDPNFYALNLKICIQCSSNCLSCDSFKDCQRCAENYLLIDGKCYNSICQEGYFFSFSSLSCVQCEDGCLECFQYPNQCTKCTSARYFLNYNCLQVCPDGYYNENTSLSSINGNVNNKCLRCNQSCESCIDSSENSCSSCPAEKYLTENLNCEISKAYFCVQTLSTFECLQCDAYMFLENRICKYRCSSGFYGIRIDNLPGFYDLKPSYKCLPCPEGCKECKSENICTECYQDGSFLLSDQKCLRSASTKLCQQNQFWDLDISDCSACSMNCKSCRDTSTCLECTGNAILVNGNCNVNPCPVKTYYNQSLKECEMCQAQCLICQNAITCQRCLDPTDVIFQNQCIHQCPSNYFLQKDDITRSCQQCHESCNTCNESTQYGCITCSTSLQYYAEFKLCLPSCPVAQFFDPKKNICTSCKKDCQICQSFNICQQCSSGYFFQQSSSSCIPCSNDCISCSSETECLSCENNNVLVEGSCQEKCNIRDYYCISCDQITNACLMCTSGEPIGVDGFCPVICSVDNCSRCQSSSQCAECESGYFLTLAKQCQIQECNILFCKTCSYDQLAVHCDQCQDEYILFEYQCYSKNCPQYGSQCELCKDENTCKNCRRSYYYSSEYNKCMLCPERCLSCDQYQCFEYNNCLTGEYQLEKQCLKCAENCIACEGPSNSDCLQFAKEDMNCHYTCSECLGGYYNQCISCPPSRILTFYYQVKYGECKCPQGTYDALQVECSDGYIDQMQREMTVGFSYLGAVGALTQSFLSFNPAIFYLMSEFAQTLGQIQYINIKKAYDFDETMYVLQHFNYNILSGVGSNIKPKDKDHEKQRQSHTKSRNLEVLLEDLEKITSFYRSNNFFENAKILVLINVVCFSLMLCANYISDYKVIRQNHSLKVFVRSFRFSVPAFALVLTSSEMCVTIQLQMREFDLNSDQALALLLSIIMLAYQFVWTVFIVIQLGIKSAIHEKQYQLIFRIFNKKTFLQRIFFALLFIKKQFLSIILIQSFKNPIDVLIIQLVIEGVFAIYIFLVKPFRRIIYMWLAIFNQLTFFTVNTFMVFISTNEQYDSQLKPILYIIILCLILLVMLLYSLVSIYMIIMLVKRKMTKKSKITKNQDQSGQIITLANPETAAPMENEEDVLSEGDKRITISSQEQQEKQMSEFKINSKKGKKKINKKKVQSTELISLGVEQEIEE